MTTDPQLTPDDELLEAVRKSLRIANVKILQYEERLALLVDHALAAVRMREAQKAYYNNGKSKKDLENAKRLETILDLKTKVLEKKGFVIPKNPDATQTDIFKQP